MDFNAHTIENFLSESERFVLVNAALSISEAEWNANTSHSFWQGRVINLPTLGSVNPIAYKLIRDEIFPRIREALITQYAPKLPVYPDAMDMVRWPVGLYQNPHWDDMSGLGEEHAWNAHRKYGVILYLNDDYEGGQTYYPKFNHYITPKAGMLAMHPGDETHEHGVTQVNKSVRYTISSFWHHKPSKVMFNEFKDDYYNITTQPRKTSSTGFLDNLEAII